jgi:hypothetical protein
MKRWFKVTKHLKADGTFDRIYWLDAGRLHAKAFKTWDGERILQVTVKSR